MFLYEKSLKFHTHEMIREIFIKQKQSIKKNKNKNKQTEITYSENLNVDHFYSIPDVNNISPCCHYILISCGKTNCMLSL